MTEQFFQTNRALKVGTCRPSRITLVKDVDPLVIGKSILKLTPLAKGFANTK